MLLRRESAPADDRPESICGSNETAASTESRLFRERDGSSEVGGGGVHDHESLEGDLLAALLSGDAPWLGTGDKSTAAGVVSLTIWSSGMDRNVRPRDLACSSIMSADKCQGSRSGDLFPCLSSRCFSQVRGSALSKET